MTDLVRIAFAKPGRKFAATVIALVGPDLVLGPQAQGLGLGAPISRAAAAAGFSGKAKAVLDLLAPAGADFDRLILVGTGAPAAIGEKDWVDLGGAAAGALHKPGGNGTFERPDGAEAGKIAAADFALGMKLRAYAFDNYRTDGNGDNDNDWRKEPVKVTIHVDNLTGAKAAWTARSAIADGVLMARDLVNEPANVLGPVEFAERAKGLKELGVQVEVLTEAEMKKHGMRALLGVAQGSARPPRLVVMRWNGGRAKDKPVAFVGKGVTFDTGGISIKPAAGMEDMKGDMAGAAATGLMRVLAGARPVNAVGVIGVVRTCRRRRAAPATSSPP
jgi:leucyl aminopeptidase